MCQNKARFGSKVKEITFGTLDATPAVAVAVAVAAAAAVLNPLIDPPTLQARVLGWWWLWSQNGVVKRPSLSFFPVPGTPRRLEIWLRVVNGRRDMKGSPLMEAAGGGGVTAGW